MNRLAYLTAMALLGIGLTMAQNSSPSSDPSNSSNPSAQAQSGTASSPSSAPAPGTAKHHRRSAADATSSEVPDPTVQDKQNSTTSTTGAGAQSSDQPSQPTMGTTGSTPGTEDQAQPKTAPQNGTPVDQQPNSSSSPSPHAALPSTPGARAARTHTPDPGTCMNPVALESTQVGDQTVTPSPCH